jgi:ketosteroid isomerase-like protein
MFAPAGGGPHPRAAGIAADVHRSDIVVGWYEQTPNWDAETIDWWSENVWHPDIEWRAIQGAPDDVGPMQGRERLRRYYGEWLELFGDIRHEIVARHDVGELVVLGLRITARSRSADMPLELNYAVVHELSDGKLRRGREYATLDEALRAAEPTGARSQRTR